MKLRLFIFLIVCSSSSVASTLDTLLFSSDGKFVLFKDHESEGLLNGCPVDRWTLYETGNDKREEIIAMYADSAYELSYADSMDFKPVFKTKDCLTGAHITNRYAVKDFMSVYKLSLKAYPAEAPLTLKVDTVKIYTKKEMESSKYYDLSIHLLMGARVVHTAAVSTDFPDDIALKQNEFRLYFSEDNKYFFLYGEYGVGSSGGAGAYILQRVSIRLLNIKE